MPFYRDRISVVDPKVTDGYGDEVEYEYDPELGATVIPVIYGVEFQPQNSLNDSEVDNRLVISVYRLHTPPGKGLPFRLHQRILFKGDQYTIQGDLAVWTSTDYPSGIDHVEAVFQRVGASDGS